MFRTLTIISLAMLIIACGSEQRNDPVPQTRELRTAIYELSAFDPVNFSLTNQDKSRLPLTWIGFYRSDNPNPSFELAELVMERVDSGQNLTEEYFLKEYVYDSTLAPESGILVETEIFYAIDSTENERLFKAAFQVKNYIAVLYIHLLQAGEMPPQEREYIYKQADAAIESWLLYLKGMPEAMPLS